MLGQLAKDKTKVCFSRCENFVALTWQLWCIRFKGFVASYLYEVIEYCSKLSHPLLELTEFLKTAEITGLWETDSPPRYVFQG